MPVYGNREYCIFSKNRDDSLQFNCLKGHFQSGMFLTLMSIIIMSLSRSGRLDDSTRARLSLACGFSSLVSAQDSSSLRHVPLFSKKIYTLSRHDSSVCLCSKHTKPGCMFCSTTFKNRTSRLRAACWSGLLYLLKHLVYYKVGI